LWAEAGLARELREELGVEAVVGAEVFRTRHRYAELGEEIELIFFSVVVKVAAVRNIVFESMEWRAAEALGELNFLPADREFAGKLARREIVAAVHAHCEQRFNTTSTEKGKRDPSLRSG
jgi:8-oxo-dGTP pyrophosphatase MutT (NUDIX family)